MAKPMPQVVQNVILYEPHFNKMTYLSPSLCASDFTAETINLQCLSTWE